MGPMWVSALSLLLVSVRAERDGMDSHPCAEVRTSSAVVVMGSPVVATCRVRDDCPLTRGRVLHLEWQLGRHHFPSSPTVKHNDSWSSTLLIPSFNTTQEYLTCCIHNFSCMIVGGVGIRAGYGPAAPQNLSCQTNLTTPSSMSCSWAPGERNTHLPTTYTLHTEIGDLAENHTYEPPMGVYRYTIPRSGFAFYSKMGVWVTAQNALGEASSSTMVLEPLRSAKFDPPAILKMEAEPGRYGCLRFRWRLSRDQAWVLSSKLNLQARLKPSGTGLWAGPPIPLARVAPQRPVEVCRQLHGTEYEAQIRVRYQQSPWSEWSPSQSGVTLERAPTGQLDTWMKVSGELEAKQLRVHLFWKPSKQFHANGNNVSYVVSLQRSSADRWQLCSTSENNCVFQLPKGVTRVFLRAANAAGISNPMKVLVFQQRDRTSLSDLTVLPHDDSSMRVLWTCHTCFGVTGYVVEWRPLLNLDPSHVLFELVESNQFSLNITGSFEPYRPYEISVYPRYMDGIGLPRSVDVYSRQKAPSTVPNIRVKETWHSYIELTWNEIPLAQRNGIIRSYRVFYWDDEGHVGAVDADVQKRKVVLRDLDHRLVYKAFIMVTTDGGSQNGSAVTLKPEPVDAFTVVMIVMASGVGLALVLIFTVMTSHSSYKCLKVCFWPRIPDPANSSIKRWTSEELQDIFPAFDFQEPGPAYLSHLSLLDLSKKLNRAGDEAWQHSDSEETSDLGESICGSPLPAGYSGSSSESTPYATILVTEPYARQPASQPHPYLRSDSTQPLLEAEEPFSPTSYQNMSVDDVLAQQCFFPQGRDGDQDRLELDRLWDDFPMLRALTVNDDGDKA